MGKLTEIVSRIVGKPLPDSEVAKVHIPVDEFQKAGQVDTEAPAVKTINLQLDPHTIFIMCGPPTCGKSTLAKSLQTQLEDQGFTVPLLSTDEYRRALLGEDLHRFDPRMMSVSDQAFRMLECELNVRTQWPSTAEFIIIDSKAFSEKFRDDIRALANRRAYKVILFTFEYKDGRDYYKYTTDAELDITKSEVDRYKKIVLPNLKGSQYDQRIRIQRRTDLMVPNVPLIEDFFFGAVNVPQSEGFAVIGDSHECVEELEALLTKLKEQGITTIAHVGDYLDKGGNTKGMVEFMHARFLAGDLIDKGNHEAYVARRLRGEIKSAGDEIEATYFTALPVLQTDPELAKKFLEIYDGSLPFLRIFRGNTREVIVTHAPCETKYLGKVHDEATRAQRNLYRRVKDGDKGDPREEMSFIYEEASFNHPIHIFGHVSHACEKLNYKNKVFLDTGAVHGGKLTAFVMRPNKDYYEFVSVDSKVRIPKELNKSLTQPIPVHVPFNIWDYDLSVPDMRLVRDIQKNGTRYLSGTMAPAPSTETELESLAAGLEYFRKKGITRVVLQPKYMGSRAQVYLRKGDGYSFQDEAFATSRRGWRIGHVDRLDAYLLPLVKAYAEKVPGWDKELLLDGELMPWHTLGAGLIEKEFTPYCELVSRHLSTLAGDTVFQSFELGKEYNVPARLEAAEHFDEVLGWFAGEGPIEFKPFNILSVDGKTLTDPYDDLFAAVNDDDQCVVQLNDSVSVTKGHAFFKALTVDRHMEGVVIKPLAGVDGALENVVPYMKVRSEDYLVLVYGYDYKFEQRYGRLCRQKNISGKAGVSLREHRMAQEMLLADEDKRLEISVKLIGEMNREAELDPRL